MLWIGEEGTRWLMTCEIGGGRRVGRELFVRCREFVVRG